MHRRGSGFGSHVHGRLGDAQPAAGASTKHVGVRIVEGKDLDEYSSRTSRCSACRPEVGSPSSTAQGAHEDAEPCTASGAAPASGTSRPRESGCRRRDRPGRAGSGPPAPRRRRSCWPSHPVARRPSSGSAARRGTRSAARLVADVEGVGDTFAPALRARSAVPSQEPSSTTSTSKPGARPAAVGDDVGDRACLVPGRDEDELPGHRSAAAAGKIPSLRTGLPTRAGRHDRRSPVAAREPGVKWRCARRDRDRAAPVAHVYSADGCGGETSGKAGRAGLLACGAGLLALLGPARRQPPAQHRADLRVQRYPLWISVLANKL